MTRSMYIGWVLLAIVELRTKLIRISLSFDEVKEQLEFSEFNVTGPALGEASLTSHVPNYESQDWSRLPRLSKSKESPSYRYFV